MAYDMLQRISHLSTRSSEEAHEIFRYVCGGLGAEWDGADPATWEVPRGSGACLVLWDDEGYPARVEPAPASVGREAENHLYDLIDRGAVVGMVRAAYTSADGRMAALCYSRHLWILTLSGIRAWEVEGRVRQADPEARIFALADI